MKYRLGGLEFSTKKQVTDKARELFGPWVTNRSYLVNDARAFFLDLLKFHDEWKVKTQNRTDEEINLRPESMWSEWEKPSYGLRIYFGSDNYRGSDISWRHAVSMLKPNM